MAKELHKPHDLSQFSSHARTGLPSVVGDSEPAQKRLLPVSTPQWTLLVVREIGRLGESRPRLAHFDSAPLFAAEFEIAGEGKEMRFLPTDREFLIKPFHGLFRRKVLSDFLCIAALNDGKAPAFFEEDRTDLDFANAGFRCGGHTERQAHKLSRVPSLEKPLFEGAGVAGIRHCTFIAQPEAEANTASKRTFLRRTDFKLVSLLQRVADGRWQKRIPWDARSDRGKSEHLQTTRRVEYAGAGGESFRQRKVSQKTNRPGIFGCWGKGEKVG